MASTELMKLFFLVISCFVSFAAPAASGVKPFGPAYTFKKYHITFQVHADGGYESTTEVQRKINTPPGISSGGSQSVECIVCRDELLLIEAWTIQSDEAKVPVSESSMRSFYKVLKKDLRS